MVAPLRSTFGLVATNFSYNTKLAAYCLGSAFAIGSELRCGRGRPRSQQGSRAFNRVRQPRHILTAALRHIRLAATAAPNYWTNPTHQLAHVAICVRRSREDQARRVAVA